MRKLSLFAITFTLVLGSLQAAQAEEKKGHSGGTLSGKLIVTAPERKAPTDYRGYTVAHLPPEEVVLYLKKVPGTYKAPTQHLRLDQKYLQFTHRVVPVLKGTTVDFTNNDLVYHNVFTNSQANPFDLGRKGKGETSSVKFNHMEIPVKVYCEIHSSMKAYILVLDNPFFTVVGPGQSYEIKGIPPGTYKLEVWHDYWAPLEQKITVKAGKTTHQDLTLTQVQN